jgi:retron-type reverse transcriptase
MISLQHDFSAYCRPENLHRAYLKCRQGKRKAVNTRGFEANLYNEICNLSEVLRDGSYRPSRSVCFYVDKPKLREIFAANFRDRVVHRLVVDRLEPYYEKKFISDSFACRTGKGTHKAIERLRYFLRQGTKNSKSPLYYLQLDIKGFFMQIHKPTLANLMTKNIADEKLFSVIKTIIVHNPAQNFVFKGKIPPKGILPPHKTLFHEEADRGIPIGNLTSQFFANVYLNELDQFIKRKLGVKYYIRYVDDFILMHKNPEQLVAWKAVIIEYLADHLKLNLKDEDVPPVSVYKGIDFLGYFVKPRYMLVRRRVFQNYQKTLAEVLPPDLVQKKKKSYQITRYPLTLEKLQEIQARLNSYIAHFQYANSFSALKNLQKIFLPYEAVIRIHDNYLRIPKYLSRFYRLQNQVDYFKKQFPGMVLVLPMGKFYEIYGKGAAELAELAGLKAHDKRFLKTWGIRRKYFVKPDVRRITVTGLCRLAKKNYIPYVFFRQDKVQTERVKLRLPLYSITYTKPLQLELKFT